MRVFVALLRGINVGKTKIVKMDELKTIFQTLEFKNIETYIRTGNVIFETREMDSKLICNSIQKSLKLTLGYEVPVIVRSGKELVSVLSRNPFESVEGKLHVTFLSEEPTLEAISKLISYKKGIDDFQILNKELYLLCLNGYGDTKFNNNFIEKKLGVSATTRNWETVNKLIKMVESYE